jgi:4'-phosphopantetheinyl transferase
MIAASWHRLDGTLPPAAGLTPQEQARADGFGSARRRRQYLAGRQLLRQVAACVLNLEARQIALSAEGLPRCLNQAAPLWLSLSHSGPFVAAVASSQGPVGIDVEQRERQRDWAGLAAGLGWTGAEAARPEGFLLRWTLKEALFKAGMGAVETAWQAVSDGAVLTLVGHDSTALQWLSAEHPDLKKLAVTI